MGLRTSAPDWGCEMIPCTKTKPAVQTGGLQSFLRIQEDLLRACSRPIINRLDFCDKNIFENAGHSPFPEGGPHAEK
jgi:hypothetical protein